jgi:hypothetical protein
MYLIYVSLVEQPTISVHTFPTRIYDTLTTIKQIKTIGGQVEQ